MYKIHKPKETRKHDIKWLKAHIYGEVRKYTFTFSWWWGLNFFSKNFDHRNLIVLEKKYQRSNLKNKKILEDGGFKFKIFMVLEIQTHI